MTITEHYINLLLSLPRAEPGVAICVTVDGLAGIFCCSPRNVKLLLRKMVAEGLAAWRAGQGRGHRSTLTPHVALDAIVARHLTDLLRQGRLTAALDLLGEKRLPPSLREDLYAIFRSQFGLSVEPGEGSPTDVVRIPMSRRLTSLDPACRTMATEAILIGQLTDTLVRFDPATGAVEPHVAHAWDTGEEHAQWTLYLRKGVRFHHGRKLGARDVIHSMARMAGTPSRWMLRGIETMEAVGEMAVRFRLRQPNRLFLNMLASVPVLPHDVPFSETKLGGSGPFRMVEQSESRLVLEAFDEYFLGRPLLDRVEIWVVPPETKIAVAYQLGSEAEGGGRGGGPAHEIFETGCRYLAFNYGRPGPQHDFAFRKALRIALDRVAWVRELGGVRLAPASGFSPRRSSGAAWGETSPYEARAWLERSGYRGEVLQLAYYDRHEGREDAEWVERRCRAIGINLALGPFSASDLSGNRLEDADLILLGEVFGADEDLSFVQFILKEDTWLHRSLAPIWGGVLDSSADRLFAVRPEEREAVKAEFEGWLEAECAFLCNYHVHKRMGVDPGIQGFESADFGWADFRKLWIRPGGGIK